jgi:RNA polymerase sigma factor (sigma-70 family)
MDGMRDRTRTLWESWRDRRDGAAFASLVEPEIGRALGLARSIGCGPEDAEDAVQDALLQLASAKGDEPGRVGVRAWFFRAVRDRARSRSRSGWRIRRRERAAARPEAVPETGERLAIREQVERALLGLDEDDREAVRLRFLQDLDYREMAFVLGTTEGACRVRVHRALERLKAALGAGAAALLASLAMTTPAQAQFLVQSALASVPGAGSAAGGFVSGGSIAMAGTGKIVLGIAVGAALGLVGGFAVGNSGTVIPSPDEEVVPAAGPRGERNTPAPETAREGTGGAAPARTASAHPAFADLAVTPDETRFLREALLAERVRRSASTIDAADSGLDILRKFLVPGAGAASSNWSFGELASHVRTGGGERRTFEATGEPGKPTVVDLAEVAGKSALLEFGAGTFTFDPKGRGFWQIPQGTSVESLEIRGAGMDSTVLLGTQGRWLLVLGEVRNLRIRDVTLVLDNEALVDLRGGLALSLENVRVRASGGQSITVLAGDSVVLAKGCEFLGHADQIAFSPRATSLAVFEGCFFADWYSVVVGWTGASAKSLYRFTDCTFENCRVTDNRILYKDRPEFPVHVTGGAARFGGPDLPEKERRARWGAEFLAGIESTTFGPGVPNCTVGDLAAVLERLAPGPEEIVVCLSAHGGSRGGPLEFSVVGMDRRNGATNKRFYRWAGGVLEQIKRDDRGGGPALPGLADVEQTAPLSEILGRAALAPSTAAVAVHYGSPYRVEAQQDPVPIVRVEQPEGWPGILLNARTGADLRPGR